MQLIRNNKSNQNGAVLIAVVGVLAVIMVMAITFSIKMQSAIDKASSKALTSDVRSVANSGLMYVIFQLLGNGSVADENHQHSAMEQEMEMGNISTETKDKQDIMGSGFSELIVDYNRANFADRSGASDDYMPALDLNPGTVQYLIEDLSAKLPLGHVSQYFQRYLISAALYSYMGYPISELRSEEGELLENSDHMKASQFDHHNGSKEPLYIRSIIPWKTALDVGISNDRLKYKGLPLADGVLSVEELGHAHTHLPAKSNSSSVEQNVATDEAIGEKRYIKLVSALTSYSRFLPDAVGFNNSGKTSRISNAKSDVWYTSMNPRVMYNQDKKLFQAMFAYDKKNPILKMMYSVSIPPAAGGVASDQDTGTLETAIADLNYFSSVDPTKGFADNTILRLAMSSNSLTGTSSINFLPHTYNARNKDDPLKELETMCSNLFPTPFGTPSVSASKGWSSFYFNADYTDDLDARNKAYYDSMEMAISRLATAMKSGSDNADHDSPAENVLSSVVTRRALEYMIIKCVFGDSILFAVDDTIDTKFYKAVENTIDKDSFKNNSSLFFVTINDDGDVEFKVNHGLLVKALEKDKIDLDDVVFVKNALLENNIHDDYAEHYFVPAWQYDQGKSGNLTSGTVVGTKLTPQLGFGIVDPGASSSGTDARRYKNYLAHPETDQRGLRKSFVSVPAMASYLFGQDGLSYKYASPDPDFEDSPTSDNVETLYLAADVPFTLIATAGKDVHVDLAVAYTVNTRPTWSETPMATYSKVLKIKAVDNANAVIDYNFLPADFGPFETKVRLAVLINLLNAIIPPKVSPTRNSDDANGSLFAGGSADTLKGFIEFVDGQYLIENNGTKSAAASTPPPNNFPTYMGGTWSGGIETAGMTFWKYGVHSTTFKVTVDATKYDDSVRQISVVTFDTDNKLGQNNKQFQYNVDTQSGKFDVDDAVYSAIFLHPRGRAVAVNDNMAIGSGKKRYPYFELLGAAPAAPFDAYEPTDGYRIISSIWTDINATSTGNDGEGFTEFNESLARRVNDMGTLSPDGNYTTGNWYYVDHPDNGGQFSKFGVKGSTVQVKSFDSNSGWAQDNSTGTLKRRYKTAGVGSWVKWYCENTLTMDPGTLECIMEVSPGRNGGTGSTVEDKYTHVNVSIWNQSDFTLIWGHNFKWKWKKSDSSSNRPGTLKVDIPITWIKGNYYVTMKWIDDPLGDKADEDGDENKIHYKRVMIREKN
ncbi:MAG: hypothetical protein COA79_03150 [Planctomycetota bacterium]|nr:MAG: hypothetical protein COA79_03150 [Planctomycetota bacterium]